MIRFYDLARALLGAGLFLIAIAGSASAQMSSDPTEIRGCLCQQQGVAALSAEMSAKTQALAAARQRVADLDAQLVSGRHYDVNNPDAVAHYKALLSERDQAYQASTGPVVGDADQATARYNAHVNQYNTQCANRTFNADVMAQLQANLSCPPLQ